MKKSILYYKQYIAQLHDVLMHLDENEMATFVDLVSETHKKGRTIFIVGNGGSASTASHWSNDLSKGLHHRSSLKIKTLSLTDNISWISAVANDMGYDQIFSDQLQILGKNDDLLIAISASGNSPNILRAIGEAKKIGMKTLSLVGFDGGAAKKISDYYVHIHTETGKYSIAEDVQLILNHFLCDFLASENPL